MKNKSDKEFNKQLRCFLRSTQLMKIYLALNIYQTFHLLKLQETLLKYDRSYQSYEGTCKLIKFLTNEDVSPEYLIKQQGNDDELANKIIDLHAELNKKLDSLRYVMLLTKEQVLAFCNEIEYRNKCIFFKFPAEQYMYQKHITNLIMYVDGLISKETLEKRFTTINIFSNKEVNERFRPFSRTIFKANDLLTEIYQKQQKRKYNKIHAVK